MNYLTDLGDEIRRELPENLVPPDDAEQLFTIYAVLLLSKGAAVTAADVHNAWVAWMVCRGETHRSMVPFDRLDRATRAEDSPFVAAIQRVAARYSAR